MSHVPQKIDFSIGNRWGRLVEFSTDLCELEPRISSGILQRLFMQWFKHNPGKHPFNHDGIKEIDVLDLEKLVGKAPEVFLEGMIPVLNESIQIAQNKNSSNYSTSIHVLYESSSRRGPNALFTLYRNALRKLAETSPSKAASCLDRLDPASHAVLLHLHLETISVNPSALGHRLSGLLDDPKSFFGRLGRSRVEIICGYGTGCCGGTMPASSGHREQGVSALSRMRFGQKKFS